ncbi:MAG: DNA polymerase-3 subunit delta' [Hyphomicrobiaceae bacterium]|jgi:DNA polymerase-3 subunit delta'
MSGDSEIFERPLGHEPLLERLDRLADLARGEDRRGLHHAYVFAGPTGIGKFATALWWASLLKCQLAGQCSRGSGCPTCSQISAGTHRDVHILNPESEGAKIKIDQTRSLLSTMARRPTCDGPNIAIVREADSILPAAQNSLLKLLEEPPGFAVLILVADNPAGLLPTIRSRCQVIRFGALPEADLLTVLNKHGFEGADAARMAAAGRGSAGRALALDPEGLDNLDALHAALEQVGTDDGDMDGLLDAMIARKTSGYALEELLAWQLRKLRVRLGVDSPDDPTLAPQVRDALEAAHQSEPFELAQTGERMLRTASALERNANAKIAIRDLLLHVRG